MCPSILVGASPVKYMGGFALLSGMNALNVKLVKAHWHECSIETMPTYIQSFSTIKGCAQGTVVQVALLAKQAGGVAA